MKRVYAADVLGEANKPVLVQGWVQETRTFGGLKFIILKDRSGQIQITLPKKEVKPEVFDMVDKITKESVIYVKGVAKKSEKALMGAEVIPETLEVISLADAPTPIDTSGKIESDLSVRLDHRFLDVRNRKSTAIFTIRSKLFKAIVEYFDENGFVNINTPKLTTIGVETGAELFEVKYFDRKVYLAQSPQVYKQMFGPGAFERVYEIAPVYRAEKSHTAQHLTEFIGVDFEQAFIESEQDIMDTVEGMMRHAIKSVRDECGEELGVLKRKLEVPVTMPRIKMEEAKKMLAAKGYVLGPDDDLGAEEQEVLANLVKEKFRSEFFFVYEYPFAVRPFYHMKPEGRPDISKSFDLIWNGVEIATGAQREHRHSVLKQQATDKGIDLDKQMAPYAEIFRYGCPPHGGTGLGLDRITECLLGLPNIRECILLPRDPERISP
ncbi:MAG: aspartate--tRNA(Asn) ligase [Candidatus Diapherotrites archaeon]|nr:aspartate--tRNA(Asn) ligase [Candidatus Diapherotrites archaeon]